MELYRENFRNLPVPNHKAYGYQILHVAVSSGPSPRGVNYNPRVELIAKGYKFYIGLYSESCEIFLLLKIRTMATNFSPCKGSYVLNQFPSNVMFGMNGFHVSASGAIQGHHGPLVEIISHERFLGDRFQKVFVKFWSINKHGYGEWGLLALYGHEEIRKKSSSQKPLVRFWNNFTGIGAWH